MVSFLFAPFTLVQTVATDSGLTVRSLLTKTFQGSFGTSCFLLTVHEALTLSLLSRAHHAENDSAGEGTTVTQKTIPMFATFDFLPLYLHN